MRLIIISSVNTQIMRDDEVTKEGKTTREDVNEMEMDREAWKMLGNDNAWRSSCYDLCLHVQL